MKPGQLPVTLQLGKAGITETFLEELRHQVKRNRMVKIRFPPPQESADRERLCEELAQKSGCVLVEVRGHTAVFRNPRFEARES